jgi:environmental stress-induced protein Ves
VTGSLRLLRRADYRRTRWANDGGWTTEIARDPSDPAAPFRWRISIAEIEADGPFSHFPGIDRQLVLLDGNGMRLDIDGIESRLAQRFDVVRFAGGAVVQCRLLDGPTTDFNLMTRRGDVDADLRVECGIGQTILDSRTGTSHWLVHVVDGSARIECANNVATATSGETLWLDLRDTQAREPVLEATGHCIVVRIRSIG